MNSEYVYDHFTLTITEKVTMEKPDPSHFYNLKGDYYLDQVDDYNEHVATRRSFHYELSEDRHGDVLREGIDFEVRFQQCTEIKGRGKVWEDCTEALYSMSHVGMRRIVAVPIVPVVKQDDCSGHKKEVAGITDMKILAELIGDLHYKTLFNLLYQLSKKIENDSIRDNNAGREKLAAELQYAGMSIFESALRMERVWKISKPFMKDVTEATQPH